MRYKFDDTRKETTDKLNSSPEINHEDTSTFQKALKSEIDNGVLIKFDEQDLDENDLFDCSYIVEIASQAFKDCKSLKALNLPGVTKIGEGAFFNCDSLVSVNIPEVMEIENFAFNSCVALTTVDFPKLTRVGYSAFACCFALTSVNLPELEKMGEIAFYSCRKLELVKFPRITMVEKDTFCACQALTTVNLPKAEVISPGAFYGCGALSIVVLHPQVWAHEAAFPANLNLKKLIIAEDPSDKPTVEQLRRSLPLSLRNQNILLKKEYIDHLIFSRKAGNTLFNKDVSSNILTFVIALGLFNKKDKENNEEPKVTNPMNFR